MITCKKEEVDFAPVAFPTPNPASTESTPFSSTTVFSSTTMSFSLSMLQNVCNLQYTACLTNLKPPNDRNDFHRYLRNKGKCKIAEKDCLSAGTTTLESILHG